MPLIKKYIFVSCLLVAIASLGYHRYHYRAFYPDTALQLQSTHVLQVKGEPGYYQVKPENQWKLQFIPLKAFPPGYAYILYGMNMVFSDPLLAILLLELAGNLLFVISSLLILAFFHIKVQTWVLFTAYCTVSITLLHPLPATDLLTLGVFSISIYILVSSIREDMRNFSPLLLLFISGGLLGLTAYLKYLYLVFLLAIPLALFTWSWIKKNKYILFQSLVFSFLPFFILLCSLIRWWFIEGVPYFPKQVNAAFYPSHLLHFDAFPLKSFMYFNLNIVNSIKSILSIPDIAISVIISLGSLCVLMVCIASWYNWMLNASTKRYNFAGILFPFVLGSNIAILVYSSLTTPPETDWLNFWTFVMETRYYAPSQWVILITILCGSVNQSRKYLTLTSRMIVYTSLTISLTYLLLRTTVPTLKNDKPLFPDYEYQELYHITDSIMQSSHRPLIYTTNGVRIPEAAGAIYIEVDSLKNSILTIQDTFQLMIVWDKTQSGERLLNILDQNQTYRLVHNHPYWSLYIRELYP